MSAISPELSMGPVSLSVADLERSRIYYTRHIGLRVLDEAPGQLTLGVPDRPLLYLREQPGARIVRHTTGLYHFALLLPSRSELARTLRRLVITETPLTGASDHAVSEALYLSDPDGHGIEIYRDRPRDEWRFAGDSVRMTVDPLDLHSLLAEAGEENQIVMAPETIMGHVHLHVADLAAAERFYVDQLGLELMARYGPSALFVAAGGYHHHIGLNTWAGVGAPPPPPDAAQLRWATLTLPDARARDATIAQLEAGGVAPEAADGTTVVRDPSGNRWRVVSAA
ncbi:MAG: VOC family protein [Caldilineaceae bacterium]|nr:VOC family protein [Caldilineaceae bacterium]